MTKWEHIYHNQWEL